MFLSTPNEVRSTLLMPVLLKFTLPRFTVTLPALSAFSSRLSMLLPFIFAFSISILPICVTTLSPSASFIEVEIVCSSGLLIKLSYIQPETPLLIISAITNDAAKAHSLSTIRTKPFLAPMNIIPISIAARITS